MQAVLLKLATNSTMYPELSKLAQICLIIPVSTADCERGFSAMARVKTKLRNQMKNSTLTVLVKKNVSKNVQFRFEKQKLSFNAFAVFSSRSVPFPSINRSVSFRSVLSRSVAFCVFILRRQVYTLLQLETLRERCLTPSTCDAEHLFCTLED